MHIALIFAAGTFAMVGIVALRYLLVSGGLAALTRRLHPKIYAPADPVEATRLRRQMRAEIGWSLVAALIYGVPAGLVAVAWHRLGWTQLYTNPQSHGILWLVASVPAYLFLHDSYFYWTHRLMHRPSLFKAMHAVHHQSRPPTAWAAMSFHPWEALSGALFIPALVFVLPIHVAALAIVLAVMTFFGVTNHMGWELFPRAWLEGGFGRVMITASHHHLHHRNYRSNYGLYFRFWDTLCGTDHGWAKELTHDQATAPPRAAVTTAAIGSPGG